MADIDVSITKLQSLLADIDATVASILDDLSKLAKIMEGTN